MGASIIGYNTAIMDPNNQQPYNPVPSDPRPQQQANDLATTQALKLNPLAAMQEGEEVITEIRRHPFGIISIYFFAFVGFAAAAGIVILLLPKLVANGTATESVSTLTLAGIGMLLVFMILILAILTAVYWQNRWIVTSDSVTQISQRGLFNRQVSQLSFGNLEDVTVEQEGLIPSLFNFGTLKVETAGEHSKFYFLYCPKPNFYARQILLAREIFLKNELHDAGQRRLNRL